MSALAATSWSGSACAIAERIASMPAVTLMMRPPHAAGAYGFTSVPGGSTVRTARKQPSFIGMLGSTRHRTA